MKLHSHHAFQLHAGVERRQHQAANMKVTVHGNFCCTLPFLNAVKPLSVLLNWNQPFDHFGVFMPPLVLTHHFSSRLQEGLLWNVRYLLTMMTRTLSPIAGAFFQCTCKALPLRLQCYFLVGKIVTNLE